MDAQAIFAHLQNKHSDAIDAFTAPMAPGAKEGTRDAFFKVKADKWLEVATTLRDAPGAADTQDGRGANGHDGL